MGLPFANLLDLCLLHLLEGKSFVVVKGVHQRRGVLSFDVRVLQLDYWLFFLLTQSWLALYWRVKVNRRLIACTVLILRVDFCSFQEILTLLFLHFQRAPDTWVYPVEFWVDLLEATYWSTLGFGLDLSNRKLKVNLHWTVSLLWACWPQVFSLLSSLNPYEFLTEVLFPSF